MKLGMDEIRYMNAFSIITRVSPKACVAGKGSITFFVNSNDMRKVIGKDGQTIKKVSTKLKK